MPFIADSSWGIKKIMLKATFNQRIYAYSCRKMRNTVKSAAAVIIDNIDVDLFTN